MMHSPKKVAMLIVRGLADFNSNKDKDQPKASSEEHSKKDDSQMGIDSAMTTFISAVHDKDTKKAVTALLEFIEMSSGMDYFDNEDKKTEGSNDKKES